MWGPRKAIVGLILEVISKKTYPAKLDFKSLPGFETSRQRTQSTRLRSTLGSLQHRRDKRLRAARGLRSIRQRPRSS